MLLVVLTQSLSYWLYLLLFFLLYHFGPQGPIGLMQLMNMDLLELGFEFEKLERFNLETATGGALQKKMFVKKSQNSQKNTCVRVSFYRKETPKQVLSFKFLEILNSSFFYRTLLGHSFSLSVCPLEFRSVFPL